jgi:hypothetical protein
MAKRNPNNMTLVTQVGYTSFTHQSDYVEDFVDVAAFLYRLKPNLILKPMLAIYDSCDRMIYLFIHSFNCLWNIWLKIQK